MACTNKSKTFDEMLARREEIEVYIEKLNQIIYDNETKYLENSGNNGNIIKGWQQQFIHKGKKSNDAISEHEGKRYKITENERIFSQASVDNQWVKIKTRQTDNNLHTDNISKKKLKKISKKDSSKKKKVLLSPIKSKRKSTNNYSVDSDYFE